MSLDESTPKFIAAFEQHLGKQHKRSNIPNLRDLIKDVLLLAATRGFDDLEFSILINFYCYGSASAVDKRRLLAAIIPINVAPTAVMQNFMAWFISNYRKNLNNAVSILQWLSALLENGQVEESVIDTFYFDFHTMLNYCELIKYACKFVCVLTKPEDVSESLVNSLSKHLSNDNNDKYIYAALNVFQGCKPSSVTDKVNKVDINKVLKSISQNMDFFIKLNYRRGCHLEKASTMSCQASVQEQKTKLSRVCQQEVSRKTSVLIPYPVYAPDSLNSIGAVYPRSIDEAFKKFPTVAIPQNVMSLLRDEVGLFLIMYKGPQLQNQLSNTLFQTLQEVFIYRETVVDEEDKLHLLDRVYELQLMMQQGIPSVSLFLSGFLLSWDGIDYRVQILKLLEFATFDSFQDLVTNILRPLYCLFVSYDTIMKELILITLTNMIKNMFLGDVSRVARELPHPFLQKVPAWVEVPMSMFNPLITWVEGLIKVGLCLEPDSVGLLMQSINFYEWMNELEYSFPILPLWTVITQGIIYRSLFSLPALLLDRVCHLLVRYFKIFLPQMRSKNQAFYGKCSEKIERITKYAQELLNILWYGKAFSCKEDGVVIKDLPNELIVNICRELREDNEINLDSVFELQRSLLFLPYVVAEREKHGPEFLQTKEDYFHTINFYCPNIAEFINHFSQV